MQLGFGRFSVHVPWTAGGNAATVTRDDSSQSETAVSSEPLTIVEPECIDQNSIPEAKVETRTTRTEAPAKFKINTIADLQNRDLSAVTELDIGSNIVEFANALSNGTITVPKAIEKLQFTLKGADNEIDNIKNALDAIAYEIGTQLGGEELGRTSQQVKFIADFKDIAFASKFAEKYPSIIGTTDAAQTFSSLARVHPSTKARQTEIKNAIIAKAQELVEQAQSPGELDTVIPGTIYELSEHNGRDGFAGVINKLVEQSGTATKTAAQRLIDTIATKSQRTVATQVAESAPLPATNEAAPLPATNEAAPLPATNEAAPLPAIDSSIPSHADLIQALDEGSENRILDILDFYNFDNSIIPDAQTAERLFDHENLTIGDKAIDVILRRAEMTNTTVIAALLAISHSTEQDDISTHVKDIEVRATTGGGNYEYALDIFADNPVVQAAFKEIISKEEYEAITIPKS